MEPHFYNFLWYHDSTKVQ